MGMEIEMIYLQVEGHGETDHVDHTEHAVLRYWWSISFLGVGSCPGLC